jgi:hypothetical protein
VLTISGTASAASNTYTYTITTTGTNSCATTVTGTITVNPAPDFYNTQFPANATVCQGSNAQIYGQVFEGGVTNPAGQAPGLTAEIGYSTSNTNPNTWTNWLPATFFAQVGNNDEFIANLGSTLAAGTYYYAFRYALNGCQYYYGGYSASNGGPWNGSTNVNGVIDVDHSRHVYLDELKGFQDLVMIGGDPRCGYLYFETVTDLVAKRAELSSELAGLADVTTIQELIETGWLHTLSETAKTLAPDLIVLPKGDRVIYHRGFAKQKSLEMVGQHGGMSKAEWEVPLLVF